jgi:hypothetical protein
MKEEFIARRGSAPTSDHSKGAITDGTRGRKQVTN